MTREHKPKPLFAIEVEPSSADLTENLAAYRRLTTREKAAIAAELRRKVEIEIAEARRGSRQRPPRSRYDGPLSQVRSALKVLTRVAFTGTQSRDAIDRVKA
jgi:hypothetical protein